MIDASKTKFKGEKGMENKQRCLFGQGSQEWPLCGGNVQIKDLSEQRGDIWLQGCSRQREQRVPKPFGGNSWEHGDVMTPAQWLTEKDSLRWLVCLKP